MNPEMDNSALRSLANEYIQQLNALLKVLEEEQEVLKNRQFVRITACAEQKEALLLHLEQLDTQRLALTQQLQPAFAVEIQNNFNSKIALLLNKCRDLNMVNGGIVEICRQFNQRMLDAIFGVVAPEHNVYDADGNNSGYNSNQVIAKI